MMVSLSNYTTFHWTSGIWWLALLIFMMDSVSIDGQTAGEKFQFIPVGAKPLPSPPSKVGSHVGLTFNGSEYLSYFSKNGILGLDSFSPFPSSSSSSSFFTTISSERITIQFKTRHPNGLLFYASSSGAVDGSGTNENYLKIAIKNGRVSFVMKIGPNLVEKEVASSGDKIRFDDNHWHLIHVTRKFKEITKTTGFCHFTIRVDSIHVERGSSTGSLKSLSSKLVLVGGSDLSIALPGSQLQTNFVGCLLKVQLEINEQTLLDFLSMSFDVSSGLEVHGNPIKGCTESKSHFDPVTFATSESYLALPKWECSDEGRISLKIRTNEGSGVILYSSGIKNMKENSHRFNDGGDHHTSFDFFAVELLDGHVFMLMNQGSGSVRLKATTRRVDDGQWHTISVERKGKSGRVNVDDSGVDFITPGTSAQLDLEGPLFLGGIGGSYHGDHQLMGSGHSRSTLKSSPKSTIGSSGAIPAELWAGSLGHGFVGCVRDLVISHEEDAYTRSLSSDHIKLGDIDLELDVVKSNNADPIDLSAYLSSSVDIVGIKTGCHFHHVPCEEDSCLNGGICSSSWSRVTCNCAATSFTGPNCERPSSLVTFNGDQYIRLSLPEESKTQAEDIYLRFKTLKSSGLIMATSSKSHSMNHLIILLEHSHLKVILNMGEGNRVINIGSNLNDDNWHNLKIERRGSYLMVKLDGEYQDTPISGQLMTLMIDTMYLASFGRIHISSSSSLYHSTKEVPNFSGVVSLLTLNNKNIIDMIRNGQLSNYDSTAVIISNPLLVSKTSLIDDQLAPYPFKSVTFKSSEAYIAVLPPKLSSNLVIHFLIKTSSMSGVIMLHGNQNEEDFYVIELENGFIQYTFNLLITSSGRGGRVYSSSNTNFLTQQSNHHRLHRLSSHSSLPINDDDWHSVTISKSRLTPSTSSFPSSSPTKSDQQQHVLLVDDHLSSIPSPISPTDAYTRSLSPSSILHPSSSSFSSLPFPDEDDDVADNIKMNISSHFDLSKRLVFIGGIPSDERLFGTDGHPSSDLKFGVRTSAQNNRSESKSGFIGCLASIDLNGQLIDPVNGPDLIVSSSLVEPGCNLDSIGSCSFCASKGRCVNPSTQPTTSLVRVQSRKATVDSTKTNLCECKLITYSGVTCEEHEGAAFRFSGGVLIYTFPEDKKPETKSDELTIGIKTDATDDSVLIRIDSTSSNDYIEVQIMDAHVIVIYNVGSADHFIEDLNVKVNDDNYHVIKFNRTGPNASLQVDNHNPVLRMPAGKQLTIFDAQSTIIVGGRKAGRTPISGGNGIVEKPFFGVIFTLTFNNEQVLNLGAEGDPKVSMEGRVELLVSISGIKNLNENHNPKLGDRRGSKGGKHKDKSSKINKHQQSQEAGLGYTKVGDELIVSEAARGVINSNGVCWSHDDCSSLTTPFNPLGTDDLITLSVTGSSARSPPAGSSHDTSSGSLTPSSSRDPYSADCDDEDDERCRDNVDSGSGDGDSDSDKGNGWDKKDEDLIDNESKSKSSGSSTIRPFDPWPTSITLSFPTPTLHPPSYHHPSVINSYHYQSTTEDFSQILHTFKPIPPDDTISVGMIEQSYRPKASRPTVRPAIIDVPKPSKPHGRDPKGSIAPKSTLPTPTYAAPDRTALLIGLIAVLIIVVVVIAPLFLYVRIKYKSSLQMNGPALLNGVGKSGAPNGYQFVPVPGANGTLMTVDGRQVVSVRHVPPAPIQHVNVSALDPVRAVGLGTCGPPTLKRKKDEWYV